MNNHAENIELNNENCKEYTESEILAKIEELEKENIELAIKNPQYKAIILKENFEASEEETIQEYIEVSADQDPDFFFWLLEPYTEEQEEELLNMSASQYESFINDILQYV